MKYMLPMLLALVLCGCPVTVPAPVPVPAPAPEPEPEPAPSPAPSPEMQALVDKIVPISDQKLVEFYLAFADLIRRDSDVIESTADIREAHIRAGKLMFQGTGMKGKYADLPANIDAAITGAIGLKSQPLTPELRAKAVEIMEAIAWACR